MADTLSAVTQPLCTLVVQPGKWDSRHGAVGLKSGALVPDQQWTKEHSEKPGQGSRVKPKQFFGVRTDNAKSRSQAQESASVQRGGRERARGGFAQPIKPSL